MSKILLAIGLLILLGVTVSGVWAAHFLAAGDLRPYAEKYISGVTGRRLSLGALNIIWGNPLQLEITDARLAGPDWGSEPDMVRIGKIHAVIDPAPLLRGVVQYQKLRIEDLNILLERDANGIGNWRLDGKPRDPNAPAARSRLALLPKNRAQFPNLLDALITNGVVRFRTSSGNMLRIAAKDLQFTASDETSAVKIIMNGAYNDLPAILTVDAASYRQLRRRDVPFDVDLNITTQRSQLHFNGTMIEPLDIEGSDGKFDFNTTLLSELLQAMGMETAAALPLSLTGDLKYGKGLWNLENANAKLANSDFTGTVQLIEGTRGASDTFKLDLSSRFVALKPIFDGFDTGKTVERPEFKDAAANKLDLKLKADKITYKTYLFSNAALRFYMNPGEVLLPDFTFNFAGGSASLQGKMDTRSRDVKLDAAAVLNGADAAQLLGNLGIRSRAIQGPIDMRAELHAVAADLESALKRGNGGAVMLMHRGSISRDALEKASLNLKNLFRDGKGQTPVRCMLGVITLRRGIGTIAPLTLQTAETDLSAFGQIDLNRKYLDLLLQSDPDTTGSLALDIPLRVSGPFAAIGVTPAFGANAQRANIPRDFPTNLQTFARQSACR